MINLEEYIVPLHCFDQYGYQQIISDGKKICLQIKKSNWYNILRDDILDDILLELVWFDQKENGILFWYWFDNLKGWLNAHNIKY
jgi:hypothetical protein